MTTRRIGLVSGDVMMEGIELVNSGLSIRQAAKRLNMSNETLGRYVRKQRGAPTALSMVPNYAHQLIFNADQEKMLTEYLINCAKQFFGLSVKELLKLAYEMAIMNNINIPEKWHKQKSAGEKWYRGFRKRNPQLSLRTSEGCSLSRATSFNKHNVNIFYDNLLDVLTRNSSFADGTRIFNLDETATTTVHSAPKVLALKGSRTVNKVTSGERGILVTTCCIVNATGQYLPPAMIFPRVFFKNHMINGAPSGTLGLANQSGWMNADLFVEVINHFIQHSHSSLTFPSLLIMDNHESHLSLKALNLAKENGVTILTLPPHSSNKLQPLDVGIYKAFKSAYNNCVDSWMMRFPGKYFTIYDVAACVGEAHIKALTPGNIISAFRKTGIFPYDRNIFNDDDFLCSAVTDRPNYHVTGDEPVISTLEHSTLLPLKEVQPSTSGVQNFQQGPIQDKTCVLQPKPFVSPQQFRGYPKAKPRNNKRLCRRKGRSLIATDTPVKNEIEQRQLKKIEVKKIVKAKNIKKKILIESSSDENEPVLDDSESGDELENISTNQLPDANKDPVCEDFVLIKFNVKNSTIYYVGKLISEKTVDNEFEISYLRKTGISMFVMPEKPDFSVVNRNDIIIVLPQPRVSGQTKRLQATYSFEIDLSDKNVR